MRRVIRSQSKRALDSLTEVWPPPDEGIHEARKRIKRARAGLRLLRNELGERAYRRENASLRDAARPLSEIRDAKILVDALDGLARGRSALDPKAVSGLRSKLTARQMRTRHRVLASRDALEPVLDTLRSARACLPKPKGRGWSVLGPGLRRVYRSGRRAALAAEEQPTDENLHESRKQAKYLWHELQMLEPIRPATIRRLAQVTHDLSDRLGDDHDFAVLRRTVVPSRAMSRGASESTRAAIDQRRRSLQQQARRLARRLYRERPRDFERRLGRHWRNWRSV